MAADVMHVLLVEDNPGDARLVREMLREEWQEPPILHHVDRIGNLSDILSRQRFDVILLDLTIPGSQGLETLSYVQQLAPQVPVVVLSGLDDETTAVQAVQQGAQDFLVKGQGNSAVLRRAIHYAIERKRTEDRLTYLAQYDSLTGLANRTLFQDRLATALTRRERTRQSVGLLLIDLDRFKPVNDNLGHIVGDRLLQAVAERLGRCVRKSDTIARLGGDEFAVVLESVTQVQHIAALAKKMIESIARPLTMDGHEIVVTASVGIALISEEISSGDRLYALADAAMYQAKERGGNQYRFSSQKLNAQLATRFEVERDLRRALTRDEFCLHYQAQVELRTGRITGLEALVRWHHPTRGLLTPAQFIPIAEETGLIVPLGEWVLWKACTQAQAWRKDLIYTEQIGVNLSTRQLQQPQVVNMVARALRDTGIEPHRLDLELTESVMMHDQDAGARTLHELKTLGVHLSVDDFGTGYSSLSCLTRLPVDTLKIDHSLLKGVTSGHEEAPLATAIISLAQRLHLNAIAEGVETADQAAFLLAQGCATGQGYWMHRPTPSEHMPELLRGMRIPLA